jgi:hypothetical protein
MTTRAEIEGWFDRGVQNGKRNMLIICDTFDHDDYPVYTMTAAECLARYKQPGEMQRVMEVYDLAANKAVQMKETRAMHLPDNCAIKST